MNECYSCGVSKDKAVLHKGIHKSFGIVSVCRKCYFKEKLPLVETKEINLKEIEKKLTVRERLALMAGIKLDKKESAPKKHVFTPEDIGLKNVADKNLKKNIEDNPKNKEDLIDNWNWVIMRKRRNLKLSYSQLGDEIKEQPVILEALERGKLSRDYVSVIKKLENYLQIRLFKNSQFVIQEKVIIESKVPSEILISDLKKKTEEKKKMDEAKPFEDKQSVNINEFNLEKVKEIIGEPEKKKSENKKLDDLTDEEINDLIFGRKK